MPGHQNTEVTMLLDYSASMKTFKTAIEDGVHAFIAEQRAQPSVCTISLALFDERYRRVWAGGDITAARAPDLWAPRGKTALLDAIASAVRDARKRFDAAPGQWLTTGAVIIGVVSVSLDNASTGWTYDDLKTTVEAYQTKFGWVFAYLGANQDAIEVASRIGVRPDCAMIFTAAGAAEMMRGFSAMVSRTRLTRAAGASRDEILAATAFTAEERAAAGK
jgi:hypothetical protein